MFFERAEPARHWTPVVQLTFDTSNHVRKAIADFRHGGRVAPEGQRMAAVMNGKTVPWICLGARVAYRKDSIRAHFGYSLFPAHALFVAADPLGDGEALVGFAEDRASMAKQVTSLREAVLIGANYPTARDALRFIDVECGAHKTKTPSHELSNGLLFQSRHERSQGSQHASVDAPSSEIFGDMAIGRVDLMSPYSNIWDFASARVVWDGRSKAEKPYLAVFLARNEIGKSELDWNGYGAILCGQWSGGKKLPFCLTSRRLFGVYHDLEHFGRPKFVSNHAFERGPVFQANDFKPQAVLCVPIAESNLNALQEFRRRWESMPSIELDAATFLRNMRYIW